MICPKAQADGVAGGSGPQSRYSRASPKGFGSMECECDTQNTWQLAKFKSGGATAGSKLPSAVYRWQTALARVGGAAGRHTGLLSRAHCTGTASGNPLPLPLLCPLPLARVLAPFIVGGRSRPGL